MVCRVEIASWGGTKPQIPVQGFGDFVPLFQLCDSAIRITAAKPHHGVDFVHVALQYTF